VCSAEFGLGAGGWPRITKVFVDIFSSEGNFNKKTSSEGL
jgi:hypothetical protein